MTFLNFSDYLKFQYQREIKSEEFAKFILNQNLMKIGKRSELHANAYFYYENTTEVKLDAENKISGDKIEFHSCDRSSIYYTLVESETAEQEALILKAELDKARVANNYLFLVKNISLMKADDLENAAGTEKKELVEAYA